MNYKERLQNVIPGGAHTYSRGADQYPANAPDILVRGQGAYTWDDKGNKYLDYGMALRAVTVGYANERINNAAKAAIDMGVNLTKPSMLELEAAECLVDLIPSADMVKFAKNGSNVTTAALKLARAYTGRKYVCVPRQHPFFSFDDWFIGTTTLQKGIPEAYHQYTLLFDYNDIDSLNKLFDQHPNDIAAVMLEPVTVIDPCGCKNNYARNTKLKCTDCNECENNFLHKVQNVCKKNNAVFIVDEMITGFRWHLQGAQTYFGINPDITLFGKGMANGFSLSCIAGKKEIMNLGGIHQEGMERVFLLSTTHGAEMPALAAFLETVKLYKEENIIHHLWQYGDKLIGIFENAIAENKLAAYFKIEGGCVALNYVTLNSEGKSDMKFRTMFAQEMIKNKVMIPYIAQSFAHSDTELQLTSDALHKSLKTYKQAIENGIDNYLVGPAIKPVFRKYN
ncbi:MAG: glutamate-1-semialdehyde 2,1-aminomutase [Bacteroidetes bacterium]|nr:glutamate-1-semialdehyde 2,1-aminomutase [Bacteroidota bacterium]